MALLASAIEEARRRAFVGRRPELARFAEMLAGVGPVRVMFVHGPGGIGKSALLDELAARAREASRSTVRVDLREIDGSLDGLHRAFERAASRAGDDPTVILLDGYERCAAHDEAVRHELVASLPWTSVLVIAGQDPPPTPWISDAGWRAVVSVHALGELDADESRELVAGAGAPVEQVEVLASIGRGHPLTLALLADAARQGAAVPEEVADLPHLVATLVSRVVGEVPSDAHAMGLAVCAHTWLTTQDLLRWAIGDDTPAVWAWLESRPFVRRSADGLYPHPLVRDALEADLLRRSRETYRRVHRVVHEHVVSALRRADPFDLPMLTQQKMWLHRRSPLSALYLTMRDRGPTTLVPGEEADHAAVLELIDRFEGAGQADVAARWLREKPQGLQVIRVDEAVAAFAYNVVWPVDPSLGAADPVVEAILDHAAATAPARPGEQIWIGRFVGGPAGYQRDPLAVTAAATAATIDWVTRPLAWSFVPTVDAEFWGPAMDYLAFAAQFEIELPVGITVYGNDWRRLPVGAWLDILDERELTGFAGPAPDSALRASPLGRAAFDAAVRAALRELRQPDRLRANPLTASVLAAQGDGATDVDRLRNSLSRGIDHLGREPRGERLARVLDRTYRRGAPSQEAAAEVLGLAFSTYRRHLGQAITRLSDLLWAVETGEVHVDEL